MIGIVKTWKHDGMIDYPDSVRLYVHGGITFSGELDGVQGWYAGFDMAHFGDFDPLDHTKCVRTDKKYELETNRLAEQIAKIGNINGL